MPGTLNNRLILRDKYIRDTTAIALSEGDLKEQLVEVRAQLDMLLAACKAAHYKLVVAHGHDGGYGEHPDNPLPQQLRAAIAAVEGE